MKRPGHVSIVLVGETGTGKTAQFLTFPGRRFAQVFDPGALDTLQEDVETELWLPEGDLEVAAKTVIKGAGGRTRDAATSKAGPQVYDRWARDFNEKASKGFFDEIDSYMLDSATMLGWQCLERVRWLQDAVKRDDERTDYRIAGELISSALMQVLSLPCHVLLTVHTKMVEDKATGSKNRTFSLPGGAQIFMPRSAGVIWHTEAVGGRFEVITQADRLHPLVKSSRRFAGLPARQDVTIKDFSKAQEYGIGAMLK